MSKDFIDGMADMSQFFSFEDGKSLLSPSFEYLPQEDGVGVILIHGLTASPTEMLPLGKYMAARNFGVHGVRLPGHGLHHDIGVDIVSKLTWKEWLAHCLSEIEKFSQKCSSLFICGLSMGAVLALRSALELKKEVKDKIKGLILISPAFRILDSLTSIISNVEKISPYLVRQKSTLAYFSKHQLVNYPAYPISSVYQLKSLQAVSKDCYLEIQIPQLYFLAEKDSAVDNTWSKRVINQLMEHSENVSLISLPNSGHIATVEPDQDFLFESIVEWMEKMS